MSSSTDISDALRKTGETRRRILAAALLALDQAGEMVLGRSKIVCPVSSPNPKNPNYTGHAGFLRNSGTTAPAREEHGHLTKEIGYNADYAAAVHERMDQVHNYPGSGNPAGQAKYLENPMKASEQQVLELVASRVRSAGEGA